MANFRIFVVILLTVFLLLEYAEAKKRKEKTAKKEKFQHVELQQLNKIELLNNDDDSAKNQWTSSSVAEIVATESELENETCPTERHQKKENVDKIQKKKKKTMKTKIEKKKVKSAKGCKSAKCMKKSKWIDCSNAKQKLKKNIQRKGTYEKGYSIENEKLKKEKTSSHDKILEVNNKFLLQKYEKGEEEKKSDEYVTKIGKRRILEKIDSNIEEDEVQSEENEETEEENGERTEMLKETNEEGENNQICSEDSDLIPISIDTSKSDSESSEEYNEGEECSQSVKTEL